jgi:D-alanyl-D-alanine carboxypeptidase/D-alanyl-D-alanine-endopeptidase (penicillin-binding protein 4)
VKRILLISGLTLLFLLLQQTAWTLDTADVLNLLQKNHLKQEEFGIIVVDGNRKVLGLNESRKFKPASLTKVITGAAALELLGPNYKFRTQLLQDGSILDQSIRGSLFLKSGGDPSFLPGALSILVSKLVALKIKTIEGDLIVDDSSFHETFSSNWLSESGNLNPKMFPMFINFDPPPDIEPYSSKWIETEKAQRKMINLEGRFVVYENVTGPDLWTAYQLKQLLTKKGITIKGNIKRGKVSESADVLAEVVVPLTTIIRKMMKQSNNYYADMLVRDLPIRFGEKQGKFEDGLEFVKYYLDHVQISRAEYSLNSGSGFSHRNFISPRAIVQLFLYLQNQGITTSIFFGALPVAGMDGTLGNRMKKSLAQGRIHAKTGFLRAVQNITPRLSGSVGLAGYAERPDGKTYTFAFLYNGMSDPALVRRTFDAICIELMGGTRTLTAQVRARNSHARK